MDLKSSSARQFIFFFFCLLVSISTAEPDLQLLTIGSLPLPRSLSSFSDLSSAQQNAIISPQEELQGLSSELDHIDVFAALNTTPEELFEQRLLRDARRVKSFIEIAAANNSSMDQSLTYKSGTKKGFSSSVISGIAQGSGEYFTRIGIGSPVLHNFLVIDTGSDISWLQCKPCRKCYSQTDKIYNPHISNSSRRVACNSPLCVMVENHHCSTMKSKNNRCMYEVSYGDGSFTTGNLVTETLTFRNGKIPEVVMGCGHENQGLFVGAAGLLGLGRGKLSFPSRSLKLFGSKFSYCLVDRSSLAKSSILFGESSVSRKAIFTPLLSNPRLDTFYYLGLSGFIVGGLPVRKIDASVFKFNAIGSGGVIIDSGTSVTRLVESAYTALRDAFRSAAKLRVARGFSLFDTCYNLSGLKEVRVPTVAMIFGNMKVSLPAKNYLIPVDTRGTFCFAFAPTEGGLSIIGNIQQQGMRVVFDLDGSRVGFAPNSC